MLTIVSARDVKVTYAYYVQFSTLYHSCPPLIFVTYRLIL